MQSALAKWLASEIYHNALQQGLNLKYTIVASSGHYIAGEETAAIESVEGKFPFPRGKSRVLLVQVLMGILP